MRVRKKVTHFVASRIVVYIGEVLYFSGLTALIPLLPLLFAPKELFVARYILGLALALIVASFLVIYFFTKSKKIALRALGLTTLIPGLLAVLFAYVGERRMVIFLSKFGEITPLVEHWINTYVPKAWLLAGIYIIVGVALVYWSEKARH